VDLSRIPVVLESKAMSNRGDRGFDSPPQRQCQYYEDLLRPHFEGRKFILIGGPVVGFAEMIAQLRRLGAERPLVIGSTLGTGQLPAEEDASWCSPEVRAKDHMESFYRYEALLRDLPGEIRETVERYDPERKAGVLGAIVLGEVNEVAGRPRYGERPHAWAALEDKVRVDAFWEAAGVRHAPSLIVPAERGALRSAARELDRGMGTVWAGDARDGIHGGASVTFWVESDESVALASSRITGRCDRARVMPFLEGIPCSIHGIVFPDTAIAFRPVEILTLRRPGPERLLYAGTATFWDPNAADREAMREVARRAGRCLRNQVGFRGPFTVDGVMSEEGFLPTELNPRPGAGLQGLTTAIPELPFALLAIAVQAGEALDFRPEVLESLVVEAADARRGGGIRTFFPGERERTEIHGLVDDSGRYRLAKGGEASTASLVTGPSNLGGFLAFAPSGRGIARGPSVAPRAIDAFRVAEESLGVALGPLEPARSIR
jgi:hypothetical protein